jgi:hypothetical protein
MAYGRCWAVDGLACFHLTGRAALGAARTLAGLEAFLVLSVVYLLSNTAYGIIGKDSMRVWVPWCVGLPVVVAAAHAVAR